MNETTTTTLMAGAAHAASHISPMYLLVFNFFILCMLAIDLGLFNRKAHTPSLKQASVWVAVWVSLAIAFNAWLWLAKGPTMGKEFLGGYLLELSLSVDNLFVFIVIFRFFAVPREYQHRVLFWGIITALVLRAVMILVGGALIERFNWVLPLFGVLLLYTAYNMLTHDEDNADPSKSWIIRFARRYLPMTDGFRGQKFLVRENGILKMTPLLLVLLYIEVTDVMFALDSIPAVFGITQDKFIVYTSNVFAILGLRSMYFLLAGIMDMFRYLKYGLVVVLAFVGVKLVLLWWKIHIPIELSLGVIIGTLGLSVALSILAGVRERKAGGDEVPTQE